MKESQKTSSFKVPKNYFSQKEKNLKSIAQTAKAEKSHLNLRLYAPYLAVAASLLLVYLLWPFHKEPIAPSQSHLSSSEILAFLKNDTYSMQLNATHTANYSTLDSILPNNDLELSADDLIYYLNNEPLEIYNL